MLLWSKLPPVWEKTLSHNLKGAIWVLVYCVSFTVSMSVHKLVNPAIPVAFKIFIRTCFGLLFFTPLIYKEGKRIFSSHNYRLHILRIGLMSVAMGGTYFTYTHIPLTLAVTIGFSGPIFTAILSYFILKDKLSIDQWLAVLIGYIGVLIMINPTGSITNTIYIAILGNIFTGLNLIYAKKLTKIDPKNTIVILGNIGVIITSGVWSAIYWGINLNNPLSDIILTFPTSSEFLILGVMGCLGAFSQIAYITALSYSSPAFLGPFEYTRLVLAVPIGLALGEAFPTFQEQLGIFIIILSTLYMTRKGRNHAKS